MQDSIQMIVLTSEFLFSSDFNIKQKAIEVNKIKFLTLAPVGNRDHVLDMLQLIPIDTRALFEQHHSFIFSFFALAVNLIITDFFY